MVVGTGLIAKKFNVYADDDKYLIFASGVSNSKSTLKQDYDREFNLLKDVVSKNSEKTFVYFSTCSINDPSENSSDYVKHKIAIEDYIQSHINDYIIFRISNLVGRWGNANTVLNFIAHNIQEGVHFNLWLNATRNLIDVEDFYSITNYIIHNRLFPNQVVNIANPKYYSVPEIVVAIEKHYGKKGNYESIARGGKFDIDISPVMPIIEKLKINFGDDYLGNLLSKYY